MPVHESINTQPAGSLQRVANYQQSLRNPAACGVRTVTYKFMPVLDWTCTDRSYAVADGSRALRFERAAFVAFDALLLERTGAAAEYSPAELATDGFPRNPSPMMTKRELALLAATALLTSVPLVMVAANNHLLPTLPASLFEWKSIKATPTKVGEKRQFLDSSTETLENLEIHATTLNPGGFAHPAHRHPEEELMIVKEGTVEALVNGERKRVGRSFLIFQAACTVPLANRAIYNHTIEKWQPEYNLS